MNCITSVKNNQLNYIIQELIGDCPLLKYDLFIAGGLAASFARFHLDEDYRLEVIEEFKMLKMNIDKKKAPRTADFKARPGSKFSYLFESGRPIKVNQGLLDIFKATDIDLYFSSEESRKGLLGEVALFSQGKIEFLSDSPNVYMNITDSLNAHNFLFLDQVKAENTFSPTMPVVKYGKIQLITLPGMNGIENVLNSFDLSLSKCAWKDGTLYIHKEAVADIESKEINFEPTRKGLTYKERFFFLSQTIDRVIKYKERFKYSLSKLAMKHVSDFYIDTVTDLELSSEDPDSKKLIDSLRIKFEIGQAKQNINTILNFSNAMAMVTNAGSGANHMHLDSLKCLYPNEIKKIMSSKNWDRNYTLVLVGSPSLLLRKCAGQSVDMISSFGDILD